MNKLFIGKNFSDLSEFICNLQVFLAYNIKYNVFHTLDKLKHYIDTHYKRDTLSKNILQVNNIILKIFNTTIDIIVLFIPGLISIKSIFQTIKHNIDTISNDIEEIKRENVKVDIAIKKLMSVDIQKEITKSVNFTSICNYITTEKSDNMIEIIEVLQSNYLDLINVTHYIKDEIDVCKSNKKNILMRILVAAGK